MDTNPQQFRGRPFMPGGGFDHHGGGSTLEWVIFALQLLMLAALAVLIARAFMRRGPGPGRRPMHMRRGGPPDPLHHLQMRYAAGEISRDEYLQAQTDLGGPAPTAEPT